MPDETIDEIMSGAKSTLRSADRMSAKIGGSPAGTEPAKKATPAAAGRAAGKKAALPPLRKAVEEGTDSAKDAGENILRRQKMLGVSGRAKKRSFSGQRA